MDHHYGRALLKKEITLDAECELRFDIGTVQEAVFLKLHSGSAEIFGTRLVQGREYLFTLGAKVAVFTWRGCDLTIFTRNDTSYVANKTPMTVYRNCQYYLERRRKEAEINDARGPITMIVGPRGVGKSTLAKILLNYSVRMRGNQRRPIFVDLDVGQGDTSIPGAIGAVIVKRPASVYDGFPLKGSRVFHYGYSSPSCNPKLYETVIRKLAGFVHSRMDSNKKVKSSGVIINTLGWSKEKGHDHLKHIALEFKVDIVLVLGEERLYNELVRNMPQSVNIFLLPKSGGAVQRNTKMRVDTRVREYFYGAQCWNPLQPHTFDIKFSDFRLYRIGVPSLPDSSLPADTKTASNALKLVPLQPNPNIVNHIVSISHACIADGNVFTTSVAGFICVTKVNMDEETVTILSPQPKPLPDACLILSDITFSGNY